MLKTFLLAGAALLALTAASVSVFAAGDPAPAPKSVYDFTVKDIDGQSVKLSKYKGNVLLIVNTASLCGNTPQYASLETMYQKYKDKGLRILAFPSNDFAKQEPGTNGEIKEFCTGKYKTSFDLFSKIDVKGENADPLYKYLTSKETDPKHGGDIEWNFAKFLIGRDGQIVDRFPAGTDPLKPAVVSSVEGTLGKK